MYFDGADVEKNFYSKGDLVFQEGEKGDAAYIVEMGEIGIFKTVEGEKVHLATMKEGEMFGEMAIIDDSKRMANAIAMEDSVVISLPRKGLESMLGKQPPMVKTLIQILADNLRSVHEAYMMRPRSVRDYMNAITFHMGGFIKYLEISKEADPSGDGLKSLKAMEAELDVLREQFVLHEDKRDSVMKPSDSFPITKTRTKAGES
ncbi:MAG: cyclic nucleotide-binding domain-containing protein [Rhodospirillales bacterium]|nr:cyclic nucleotide-binding domain-containing protein [Rhodospirillales bacterium]